MEFPKSIRTPLAVVGSALALNAAQAAPAIAQDPYVEGDVPAQENPDQEYQKKLNEYCGELATTGAFSNTKFISPTLVKINGYSANAEDPDCDDIANRQKVVLDIVQRKNGKVTPLSGRVIIKGEKQSKKFNLRLNLRDCKDGVKSRRVTSRERVYSNFNGENRVSTSYAPTRKQTC